VRALFKNWLQVRFMGIECAWVLWRLEEMEEGGVGKMIDKMIAVNKEKLEFMQQQQQRGKKSELPKSRPRLGTTAGRDKKGESMEKEQENSDNSDQEKSSTSGKIIKIISTKNRSAEGVTFTATEKGPPKSPVPESDGSNSRDKSSRRAGVTLTTRGLESIRDVDISRKAVRSGQDSRRGLESNRDIESSNVHDISIEIWEENEVSTEGYVVLLYPLHTSVQSKMANMMSESPYTPESEDLVGDYNHTNGSDDD
jgi:hypothetical protein